MVHRSVLASDLPEGEDLYRPLRTFEGRVDPDASAAFALAANDHNPRYQEGTAVPPLFTGALVLDAQAEALGSGIGHDAVSGYRLSVHGEHDVYFRRPVRPGMELRWSGCTYSARQSKGGVLSAQRIGVTDADGTLLVEHLWSTFFAGGRLEREYGPSLPDHSFPEESRDRLVGEKALVVDRDQSFRYAGVSGDHIGHAVDDVVARSEGYPGKIIQGMCSFAMASGAVVDLAGAGDPERLLRLAVRFARPVRPGSELVIRVYDAGCAGRAFVFEAEQDGEVVLKHGRAEVRP